MNESGVVKLLMDAALELREDLAMVGPEDAVAFIYQPLDYAWEAHKKYLEFAGAGTKKILFLGMNPGPWGMAQTGVPFGEILSVKSWMGISSGCIPPLQQHAKKPITGFQCSRSEVSGRRLWGFISEVFPKARDFFADHFVANYCPLLFLDKDGRNLTPDKLKAEMRNPIESACDRHLLKVIDILEPELCIGVGGFAEKRLKAVLKDSRGSEGPGIGVVLHPSPASPAANRGWKEQAARQLQELGVNRFSL